MVEGRPPLSELEVRSDLPTVNCDGPLCLNASKNCSLPSVLIRKLVENTNIAICSAENSGSNRLSCMLFGLILVAMGLSTLGCDGRPSRVPVSGQVTVDGKPLEFGTIAFYPSAGGRPGGASLAEGGSYSITMYEKNDGLPPGKYSVTVAAANWISDDACRWHSPKRYQDVQTSGLTAEIKSEDTLLNFDLTWEGDPHSEPWVEKY